MLIWFLPIFLIFLMIGLPVFFVLLPQIACPIVFLALPMIMTQSDGMYVKRFAPGNMPPARPMQFSMSQLVRVTIVMAILFALGQFGPSNRRDALISNLGESGKLLAGVGVVVVSLTCGDGTYRVQIHLFGEKFITHVLQ